MGKFLIKLVLLIILSFLNCYSVKGQVTIAPTHVFMDAKSNFANYLVMNGTDQAQEVSISFEFGYPDSDSLGNMKMVYDDSARAEQYSIAGDIRGFPQSFVLQPDQRQTVRLRMRNPQDYSEGTYWTRIKTISNAESPAIEASADDQVTAQVNFRFEQITTIFYQKGNLTTGIDFKDMYAEEAEQDSTVQLFSRVERTGNSPFLGSIELTVTGESGSEVYSQRRSTSIYFDVLRRFDIPMGELQSGQTYTAELRFISRRSDISRDNLVQTEPVSRSITFTL